MATTPNPPRSVCFSIIVELPDDSYFEEDLADLLMSMGLPADAKAGAKTARARSSLATHGAKKYSIDWVEFEGIDL